MRIKTEKEAVSTQAMHTKRSLGKNGMEIVLIIARGIGQVMLQNNALSGAIMLVGIFLSSWQMGILALVGTVVSTLTAYFMKYSREDICNGLYGFNGTLVGIAIGVFMQLSFTTLLLMVVASILSTWIAWLFSRQRGLPGFTAPFILTVWITLGVCGVWMPQCLLVSGEASSSLQSFDWFLSVSNGIGQVMFQANFWTGLLFLAGILVNSRTAAFYTILGAFLPLLFAIFLPLESSVLNQGLLGYNGVLCAIALGDRSLNSLAWAAVAVFLSVLGQWIGMELGITTLTAPFVVAVWLVLLIQKMVVKRKVEPA